MGHTGRQRLKNPLPELFHLTYIVHLSGYGGRLDGMKIHRPKKLNKHATPDELALKWKEWTQWGRRMRARMAGRKSYALRQQQGIAEQRIKLMTEAHKANALLRKQGLYSNSEKNKPTITQKRKAFDAHLKVRLPREVLNEIKTHGSASEFARRAIYRELGRR